MDSFVSDFLYAFRVFFKRPGLTVLAIVALSVSLGMSTTAFSTLNGMFFKPLPFKDPGGLHQIYLRNEKADMREMPIPHENYKELRDIDSFSDVMAYFSGTINISGKGLPERYDGTFVTPNFLALLGHQPILGHSFSEGVSMPGGPKEILISHEMWQDRFRADPDAIGTQVIANAMEYTIVGVLPEAFHFPNKAQVWMPINEALFSGERKQLTHVYAVGRIHPDSSRESAQAGLNDTFSQWTNISLDEKDKLELVCKPFGRLQLNQASNSFIVAAIGAVIFVLLISCANVANLLVGRALTRGREMAIRSAVGATRGRIIRQLLTESLVLSFFGAVGGLLYAAWAVDLSMDSKMYELPYWMNFELDWRVFLFALGVMLITTLVSGLVPAWQASKIDLNEMLKDTSHTSTSFRLGRLTRLLAVAQIAFSCALLFGAGLVTRNVIRMASIDPGFPKEDILTMRMGLFPADYPDETDRDAFYENLNAKVRQIPGVDESAVTSWLGQFGNYKVPVILPDNEGGQPELVYAYTEAVSPSYFEVLDMKVLTGRNFTSKDHGDAAQVVIVNEAFVAKHLPGIDPIGHRFSFFEEKEKQTTAGSQSLTIVGVVPSIKVSNFTDPDYSEAIVYRPYTQTISNFMSLVVHSKDVDPEELKMAIQNLILVLDPNLPVYFTKTMADFVDDQIYPFKALANFFLIIGLMALFLAAIGVYGMLAFNVSRRRREIGIRMALGANTLLIVTQVIKQGFAQVVVGITIGSGLAYLVGKLTSNFLFGINPADPSVYLGVLLTLVGVATLAFFIPARRAARLSPMEALRYE